MSLVSSCKDIIYVPTLRIMNIITFVGGWSGFDKRKYTGGRF